MLLEVLDEPVLPDEAELLASLSVTPELPEPAEEVPGLLLTEPDWVLSLLEVACVLLSDSPPIFILTSPHAFCSSEVSSDVVLWVPESVPTVSWELSEPVLWVFSLLPPQAAKAVSIMVRAISAMMIFFTNNILS